MPERHHRRPTRIDRAPLPASPLTTADLAAAGWTTSARAHAVRNGDLVRMRRGVLVPASPRPDLPGWARTRAVHLDAARAAAVAVPRGVVSHAAAAIALGLPVLRVPERPCLTVTAGTALRDVAAAHLHRATLSDDDVVIVEHGLRVTSPARTVMDVARELGVDAGVVAGDAALHGGLTDAAALAGAFEQCRGWPGRKRARMTMLLHDGRAESPLESLSRLRIRIAGLPAPEPQVDLADSSGRFLGRADFYWDAYGVVGEADGDLKYVDRDAIVRERRRQQLFEQTGLLVVRWGMRDLRTFDVTARQLREAFARGIRPGAASRRWHASLHPPQSLTRQDKPS